MSKKLMLVALAAFSALMFALPAVASAEVWHIDTAEEFTAEGGQATLTVRPNSAGESVTEVTCSTNSASGVYENTTTGKELTITFHGCHIVGSAATCTTSGQPSGTIKTTDLTFHNIMIDPEVPGILITSNAGHFASFVCGGFIPVAVNGNGIIGEVERNCGESANGGGLLFESSSTGVQKYMQVTTAGTKFDLSSTSLGTTRTASEDATGTIGFEGEQTINCTP